MREFDPKYFKNVVDVQKALKKGYSFKQLEDLVSEGMLFKGPIMYAPDKTGVSRCSAVYSTNKSVETMFAGHRYV